MWYECLPSAVIVAVCAVIPQIAVYYGNRFDCNGHPYRRNIFMPGGPAAWFRDERLSGDPYVIKGLDSIPDKHGKASI